jgi:L-aspartate oxidase
VETIDDPTSTNPPTAEDNRPTARTHPSESLPDLMWNGVGVLRDADGLESALTGLRRLASRQAEQPNDITPTGTTPADTTFADTVPADTVPADTVLAAYACATAALERTESRGAHARTDHPHTDPQQAQSRAYVLKGAPR